MNQGFRLWASLGLNVVLLATMAGLGLRKSAGVVAAAKPTEAAKPQAGEMGGGTGGVARSDERSAQSRRRAIIERLRARGVPNDWLALVARVDFEVAWDRRFARCHGDAAKMAAVQLEMNMGKDAAMRAALGEEGFKQWDQKTMLWEAMSTKVAVTPAEAETIYALKKSLQQSQFAVEQARLKGAMDDAAINEAYDKAYAEYYQKLKGVLGEERYAKSQQLDDDFVAGNLRYALAKANPTEAQFQELFKVEQGWKQARADLDHQFQEDPASQDYRAKARALDEAHELEYQRVLGTESYNALRKQQDPVYVQMKQYETLWGLDDAKVEQVYDVLRQYQSSLDGLQSQASGAAVLRQSPDPAVMNAQLQALAAQTQATLQRYLGSQSYDKLLRNRIIRFNPGTAPARVPYR